MDITKIFAILCGFLLIICITLSITCLVVMRNAVEETSVWQARAEELVYELEGCVQVMKDMESEDDIPTLAPEAGDKDAENTRYCLRLNGDTLDVYDADGYLIKRSSTRASLLPLTERERLSAGIWVQSWTKIEELLQDYE